MKLVGHRPQFFFFINPLYNKKSYLKKNSIGSNQFKFGTITGEHYSNNISKLQENQLRGNWYDPYNDPYSFNFNFHFENL